MQTGLNQTHVNRTTEGAQRTVPFLDLRVSDAERRELVAVIDDILARGRIVLGPEVEQLEKAVADRVGRKYAVSMNAGTNALFLALKSLSIGPGDEVITTSLSWIGTANSIALNGAVPVFADIQDDLNIDPASVERLITPQTKAIMPVHFTGKVCNMDALMELAERHGLLLIEDACQAFDATYHGKKAGSFGKAACFSMNSMKVFASCGEAGMVLTDSKETCDRLISLRYNGTVNRETCLEPGLNARPDTLEAGILLKRLDSINAVIERRREIAAQYQAMLDGVVDTPKELDGERDVYYTYTIRTPRRDELRAFLAEHGIETKIHHPILMPEQPAYAPQVKSKFPNAKRLVKEILSIPANEKISREDVEYVVANIKAFCGST